MGLVLDAGDWGSAVKIAKKALPDEAKVSDFPKSILKSMTDFKTSWTQFKKDRDQLMKLLRVVKQENNSVKDVFEEFQDEIDETDFGLQTPNKDDQKKIKDGRKILHDYLQSPINDWTTTSKLLRELDKQLMAVLDYNMD